MNPEPRPTPKRITPLRAVLAGAVLLFLAGIWWGLPSFRGWAPDEVVPSRVLSGMQHLFSGGWTDIYPPFHYYLLAILFSPFYLLHLLHAINLEALSWYTVLFFIARLVSVLMATATIYFIYRCGREIMDERSSLFAALISALIVPFSYYAKLANFDIPYIFWFVLSLFFFIRILRTHRPVYYWLFTAAAVLAVCTKDQAYALYILSPLAVLYSDWRHKKAKEPGLSLLRAALEKRYLFLVLSGAGLLILIDNVVLNTRGFRQHVQAMIVGSGSYRLYPGNLAGELGVLGQTIRHLRFSFGWPLILVCVAGLFLAALGPRRNRLLLTLLVFVASYYAFYTAIILYNYDRFNLPVCLILSLFGGRALAEAWDRARRFPIPRAVFACLLLGYSFVYAASVDVLMIADGRYEVEHWLRANVPKDAVLGVAGFAEYGPRLDDYRWRFLEPSIPALAQRSPRPDFVIFATAFSQSCTVGSPERRFFDALQEGKLKYRRVLKYHTDLGWLPLKTEGIATNLLAANPEIQIYQDIAPAPPRGQ